MGYQVQWLLAVLVPWWHLSPTVLHGGYVPSSRVSAIYYTKLRSLPVL